MDRHNHAAARRIAPAGRRGRVRMLMEFAPHLGVQEVPDPYYGDEKDFERVFDLAEQAARGLLRELAGV
jgi:protein-tyrosine phosphatase